MPTKHRWTQDSGACQQVSSRILYLRWVMCCMTEQLPPSSDVPKVSQRHVSLPFCGASKHMSWCGSFTAGHEAQSGHPEIL